MQENERTYFCPDSRSAWRDWLAEYHHTHTSVWLVCYKVSSGMPTLSWSDAVDEALCYGWIDSIRKTVDEQRFKQLFSRRKPKSNWSKINKDKVKTLIAEGLMTPAGMKCIKVAKANGSWNLLDDVEALVVPKDLKVALAQKPVATAYFDGLSKSAKKILLHWVVSAKRPETKEKRITEIATHAALEKKPPQFR